ncbi:hypothetical protein DFH06DRAFT_1145701 [Mycena polygramma]|nr:hypothetical protein DFH06DRAFT_1145701 [Mycena polygramma]
MSVGTPAEANVAKNIIAESYGAGARAGEAPTAIDLADPVRMVKQLQRSNAVLIAPVRRAKLPVTSTGIAAQDGHRTLATPSIHPSGHSSTALLSSQPQFTGTFPQPVLRQKKRKLDDTSPVTAPVVNLGRLASPASPAARGAPLQTAPKVSAPSGLSNPVFSQSHNRNLNCHLLHDLCRNVYCPYAHSYHRTQIALIPFRSSVRPLGEQSVPPRSNSVMQSLHGQNPGTAYQLARYERKLYLFFPTVPTLYFGNTK